MLTTVSMVIRDGDHSFVVETFFSEGLQCEQEESREQKFGYESKVSLNLLKSFTSLARISFLRKYLLAIKRIRMNVFVWN